MPHASRRRRLAPIVVLVAAATASAWAPPVGAAGGRTAVTSTPVRANACPEDPPAGPDGMWIVESDGTAHGFGTAAGTAIEVGAPVAAVAGSRFGSFVTADRAGGVWVQGSSRPAVDAGGWSPGEHVAAVAAAAAVPAGFEHWVVTDRGRVVTGSGATNHGDALALDLQAPIVAAEAKSLAGYWLVGADGGVFAFGDAAFSGSAAQLPLASPIVAMVGDPDGLGYWLVAADGGVFAFDAPFRGSVPQVLGTTPLQAPIVGADARGDGYVLVAADGGVFDFSGESFLGSLAATPTVGPVAGIAVVEPAPNDACLPG
jgi:hypothetical protein